MKPMQDTLAFRSEPHVNLILTFEESPWPLMILLLVLAGLVWGVRRHFKSRGAGSRTADI